MYGPALAHGISTVRLHDRGALFLGVQGQPSDEVAAVDSKMPANSIGSRPDVLGTPLIESLLRDLQLRADFLGSQPSFISGFVVVTAFWK